MSLPTRTQLDPAVLEEIIRIVVETAQPQQIVLFGSAARGDMGPHSDVDLLVIKSGNYNPRAVAADIYMSLIGVPQPVDIVVASPETIEQYGDAPFLIYAPALREGQTVYAA